MLRAYLVKDEGYEYINNGNAAYSLLTNGKFDYVLYEADGSVKSYDWNKSSSTVSVPAGCSIIVNATNDSGLTCAGIYQMFTIQRTESPEGFLRYKPGDTYRVENSSGREQTFFCNTAYDYTMYARDGSVISSGMKQSGNVNLPAGYSIVMSNHARVYAVISVNENLTYEKTESENVPYRVNSVTVQDDSEKTVDPSEIAGGQKMNLGITLEEKTDDLTVADVFLAIYDREGMMVDLQVWEVNFSQPLSFMQTKAIPQGVEVGSIKLMILDESLMPIVAARDLL